MSADMESRFSKIDDAIQRLAGVAADLSKRLAVQEQRLSPQEKEADLLSKLVEERRKEFNNEINSVYDTFRREDGAIIAEIKATSSKSQTAHEELNQKINKIEKLIWMVTGGGIAFGYLLSFIANYYKILGH